MYRRERDARVKQKMYIILAHRDEIPMKEVARQQRVSRATITNLVKKFNEEGIDSPIDKPRSGRPQKLDWEQLRGFAPRDHKNFDYPAQGWNRDLLLNNIRRTYG
ncbi:MAG: helix-turn-helix domain-containing protein [Candidatus Jordarchaeaceae archaeon]